MRVVSGKYRSRTIEAVKGDKTRPTLDKVKESVFNIIGPYFDGGICLDLFAGSGNLGIEAISRGIEQAYFVDCDLLAVKTIKSNLEKLKISNCKVYKLDYKKALSLFQETKFDLVFLDPPYLKQKIADILVFLEAKQMLNDNGYVVCETLKEDSFLDDYGCLHKVKDVVYGITRITIYQKK